MRLFDFGGFSNDGALLFFMAFQDSFHLSFGIWVFFSLRVDVKVSDQTDKVVIELLEFLYGSYF